MSIPRPHVHGRLDQLLADHYAAVVDLAERLTGGDRDAAQDVAQEAFAQAGQALRRGDGPQAWDGWRWLETATVRLAHARSEERTGMLAASDLGDAFADCAGARVDHALVRRALDALDRRAAGALRLYHVDGQRHGEIARRLGVPQSKVARLLAEGGEHLRREYLALAEAAGRLTLVQWTVRGLRRMRAAYHRLADDRLPTIFRVEALSTIGGWATTATNLTLAAVVALTLNTATTPGVASIDLRDPNTRPRVSANAEGDLLNASTSSSPSGSDAAPRAEHGVPRVADVKVAPAFVSRSKADESEHVVSPVEGRVDKTYRFELLPGAPGGLSLPVGFECPPPDRRPLGPAVGCPFIEAVS